MLNKDTNWKNLCRADKKGYVILSSSQGGNDTEEIDGIVQGHAYSLIACFDVVNSHGQTIRLVKMRNPWGHGVEWKGDWADNSHLWTNELKK